ncbi:MAG: hypothetical protein R3D59_18265 [Paracoccaceae bacterium]
MLAHYNPDTGEIRGFFHPSVHAEIPEPSIEISDTDWHAHCDRTALKSVDVETGELVPYVAPAKTEAEILAAREAAARAECRRRIYAEADAETQLNIATAAAVDGVGTGAEAWAEWVAQMRATWAPLAADLEADIAADASWPECPAAARDLAQGL